MADNQASQTVQAGWVGPRSGNALFQRFSTKWAKIGSGRRRLLLFGFGLLAGTAFAPFYVLPAWLIGWAGLIWSARMAPTRRQVFFDAWFWGVGLTLPGVYWITSSFLIDIARFGWMALPAVGALTAYLAIYPALAVLAAWHARKDSWAFILALAGAWCVSEWARGHVITGFPWNLAAYIWAFATPMMQSAAFWGAWGLSLVTVLATGSLVLAAERAWRNTSLPLLVGISILALLFLLGSWRLTQPVPADTGIVLRLVQANISQWDKLTGNDREGQVIRHLDLSLLDNGARPAAIIWPETAATLFLDREADWRRLIGSVAPYDGYIITGGLRGEPATGAPERYWNSLYAIDRRGDVAATFDKFHLVPLGEFVPLKRFLPFVAKLTGGAGSFSEGPGPVTLHLAGLPAFSPLICYEIIFPGAVLDSADRPDWILNITNDGWFGQSSGPYQHFASARFRAVEEGLPVVRAANSGISGTIDSLGRSVATTQLGQSAVLDVVLPAPLPPTIFANWGLVPVSLLVIVCSVVSVALATTNRSRID